jgi:hypothetical protein
VALPWPPPLFCLETTRLDVGVFTGGVQTDHEGDEQLRKWLVITAAHLVQVVHHHLQFCVACVPTVRMVRQRRVEARGSEDFVYQK